MYRVTLPNLNGIDSLKSKTHSILIETLDSNNTSGFFYNDVNNKFTCHHHNDSTQNIILSIKKSFFEYRRSLLNSIRAPV